MPTITGPWSSWDRRRYPEAAQAFEEAAKNGYDPIQCRLAKAGAIRLSGRLEEAEKLLRDSAREGATRAEYSYQMGCIRGDYGDIFGAIEYFERAVDMDPHHTAALFRLANEMNLLGNDTEAIRLYEQALSRPPFYTSALINLGLLYEDTENYPAAAFCFRRVLQFFPNHQRAQLYLKDIEAAGNMYYDKDAVRQQRELEQVMRIPIADFELSARSRNCLERAGIDTLGDLTSISEHDLLSSKNFGETSLREIREILKSRGLAIGQFAAQLTSGPGLPSRNHLAAGAGAARNAGQRHEPVRPRSQMSLAVGPRQHRRSRGKNGGRIVIGPQFRCHLLERGPRQAERNGHPPAQRLGRSTPI